MLSGRFGEAEAHRPKEMCARSTQVWIGGWGGRLLAGLSAAIGAMFVVVSAQASVELSKFGVCGSALLATTDHEGVSCAEISVPRDYDKPESGNLTLPIVRVAATEAEKAVPIFYFSGGPGNSNTSSVLPFVETTRHATTYYVGYRGADGSDIFDCPELDEAAMLPDLFSSETLVALSTAGGQCKDRLAASGVDLANYTMLDVLRDMEEFRKAIGQERVNLLSVSYGTRLAQYYTRLYPDSVERSVLIAANPPGHFVFSTYVNDKVLARLGELCREQSKCRRKSQDLHQTILSAINHKRNHPEADIDDGVSQLTLFFALYSRQMTKTFIHAAIEAESGNIEPLQKLNHMIQPLLKQTIWGDLFAKGAFESILYPRFSHSRDATATSMGSPLDKVFAAASRNWPKVLLPEELSRVALDPTETLILNGDLDVATPLLFVEAELMPFLPNGDLVVFKDMGHSDFRPKGDSVDKLISKYFQTGETDPSLLSVDPFHLVD